jgi:lysophospholipase L1-like esterase
VAELILSTDSLNAGRKKINEQLTENARNFNLKANDFIKGLRNGTITKIKLIGDSITVGVGSTGGGEDPNGRIILTMDDGTEKREGYKDSPCWANFFEQYITDKHPTIEFLNNGIGGWAATEDYYYVDQWVGTGNDVIVLMLGTNDRTQNTTKDEFETNYKKFLDYVEANSNQVIVMTASPTLNDFNEDGTQSATFTLTMEEIDEVITKVCAERKIPHISLYREFLKYASYSNTPLDLILQDEGGSHPVDEGYLLMWKIFQEKLGTVRNTYDWNNATIDVEKMRIINNHGGDILLSTPASDFRPRSVTYSLITGSHPDIANFPEGSVGVLVTKVDYNNAYAWQDYHPQSSNNVYKRSQVSGGSTWRSWEPVKDLQSKSGSLITNSSPITDFSSGAVSYSHISSSHSDILNFPEGASGTLLTYRLGNDTYGWQEYDVVNSISKYKRYWNNSTSAWSAWTKISAV